MGFGVIAHRYYIPGYGGDSNVAVIVTTGTIITIPTI